MQILRHEKDQQILKECCALIIFAEGSSCLEGPNFFVWAVKVGFYCVSFFSSHGVSEVKEGMTFNRNWRVLQKLSPLFDSGLYFDLRQVANMF